MVSKPNGPRTPEQIEAILDYCNGCMKFNAAKRECKALQLPYPLWSKKDKLKADHKCWAEERNAVKYLETLTSIENYVANVNIGNAHENLRSIKVEKEAVEALVNQDLDEARHESDRTGFPWIYAMGGSSNKDGSMFGKESMKDNRMMHRKQDPKREDWNEKVVRKGTKG